MCCLSLVGGNIAQAFGSGYLIMADFCCKIRGDCGFGKEGACGLFCGLEGIVKEKCQNYLKLRR